jgi:two-component system, OmpR family, alkaline phosphatase synthesis response regulator PhoP
MTRVLIVDDEPIVRDVVARYLKRDGFDTLEAGDGDTARELIERSRPHLVVLDVMLPGTDGLTLCRWIRSRGDLPVIMLTARGEEADRIVGLELGADDYVTKPFSPRQLVSRVRAHLRRQRLSSRASATEQQKLEFPGLSIDLLRREVLAGGRPVELTAKEFEVLALLASSPGRVYDREQVMAHLWGGDFFGEVRAADVHVQHIRQKIEPDPKNPRYVQTVRGVGYRFAQL